MDVKEKRWLVEIMESPEGFYWRLFDSKDKEVAIAKNWHKTYSECLHEINVIGYHFKEAVIIDAVIKK